MRTQNWKTANAPNEPDLVVKCACGNRLETLPVGATIIAKPKNERHATILVCNGCGKQAIARIKK